MFGKGYHEDHFLSLYIFRCLALHSPRVSVCGRVITVHIFILLGKEYGGGGKRA